MHNQKGLSFFTFIVFVAFFLSIGLIIQYLFDPIGYYFRQKDQQRISDLARMQQAFETFYKYEGRYPTSTNDYRIVGFDGKPVPWGGNWQPFINPLPKDPDSNKQYAYITQDENQSYALYTSLDQPELYKQTCGHYKCSRAPEDACGPLYQVVCNFGVSSPNISP